MISNCLRTAFAVSASVWFLAGAASASPVTNILSPTDQIYGGELVGTTFTVGGTYPNAWPGNESPAKAIDGTSDKYLNFAQAGSGFIVTPSAASVVNSLELWTANDFEDRDPASYELYGSNHVDAAASFAIDDTVSTSVFTLIASGALALPSDRNSSGLTHSQAVSFANATAYATYMLVFPTVKSASYDLCCLGSNSMQIAEVELYGAFVSPVPVPATLPLILAGLAGLGVMRRRA